MSPLPIMRLLHPKKKDLKEKSIKKRKEIPNQRVGESKKKRKHRNNLVVTLRLFRSNQTQGFISEENI